MRIIKYRQKLDSYRIVSRNLSLCDVDIEHSIPDWNKLTEPQIMAKMAYCNPELVKYGIKEEEIDQLLQSAIEGVSYKFLRFGAIDIKSRSISMGFFYNGLAGDCTTYIEDKDYCWIKIPLTSTTGGMIVGADGDEDEAYEIEWENGQITSFYESINGYIREYVDISEGNHAIDADLSTFCVTEYTPE